MLRLSSKTSLASVASEFCVVVSFCVISEFLSGEKVFVWQVAKIKQSLPQNKA